MMYEFLPRYSGGSPALVDTKIAKFVAKEEESSYEAVVRGDYGLERKVYVEEYGLRRILFLRTKVGCTWKIDDLITGETWNEDFASKTQNKWHGEFCKKCKRRNCIGFVVDNDIWSRVHEHYNVLCTTCFDELAEEKGIRYQYQKVYPISWSDW